MKLSKSTENKWILFLILFHLAGIPALFWNKTAPYIVYVIPWMITGEFILTLFYQKPLKWSLLVLLSAISICGFLVEYAGINTGWVFGSFFFTDELGMKFWSVPWIMGIIWSSLTFYTAQFKWFQKQQLLISSVFSAIMMTVFDVILENVAVKFHFWIRHNEIFPFQNYLAWFLISFIFQYAVQRSGIPFKNKLAVKIFWIQMVFFGSIAAIIRWN